MVVPHPHKLLGAAAVAAVGAFQRPPGGINARTLPLGKTGRSGSGCRSWSPPLGLVAVGGMCLVGTAALLAAVGIAASDRSESGLRGGRGLSARMKSHLMLFGDCPVL